MKSLIIFVDMIRPNRLGMVNPHVNEAVFSSVLKNLGGVFYRNCYSPGPDTPRGMATFLTGLIPAKNGCDSRMRWPRFYLHQDIDDLFKFAVRSGMTVSSFSNPNERATGLFPEWFSEDPCHNKDFDLDAFIARENKMIPKVNSHLTFVCIPDFHWAFDDYGYSRHGESYAFKQAALTLEKLLKNLDTDAYDEIFIFSDHGYKITGESRTQSSELLLDQDRTNVLMLHKSRENSDLSFDDKLLSLEDFLPSFKAAYKSNERAGSDFFADVARKQVVFEDHLTFMVGPKCPLSIWGLVREDIYYIRTLSNGYLFNLKTGRKTIGIDTQLDEAIASDSSFGDYLIELDNISNTRRLLMAQTIFFNGRLRHQKWRLFNLFHQVFDLFYYGVFR